MEFRASQYVRTVTGGLGKSSLNVDERVIVVNTVDVEQHWIAGDGVELTSVDVACDTDYQ